MESPAAGLDELWKVIDAAALLGERRMPNGTRLIGPAPHVAPEAWLHVVFPPAKRNEVLSLPWRLPSDLSEFLCMSNGLLLFVGTLSVYGLRDSYRRTGDASRQPHSIITPNVEERLRGIPPDATVFASYDWDGSKVLINTSGAVSRVGRFCPDVLNSWRSIREFLNTEAKRLSQLFDRTGKQISAVPTCPIPAT